VISPQMSDLESIEELPSWARFLIERQIDQMATITDVLMEKDREIEGLKKQILDMQDNIKGD